MATFAKTAPKSSWAPSVQLSTTSPMDPAAKSLKDMPGMSALEFAYKRWRQPRIYKLQSNVWMRQMFDRHGDIWKLAVPGRSFVFVKKSADIQTVLAADGRMPIQPIFDFFVQYRSGRRDLFPETRGLLGSHGPEWASFRALVQQDMLRARAALHYIPHLSVISADLARLIEDSMDAQSTVADVTSLLYRWALESIGAIFLEARLGCLQSRLEGESRAQGMINSAEVLLGETMQELLFGLPLWRLYPTQSYRKFDAASETMYRISKSYIDEALEKIKANDGHSANSAESSAISSDGGAGSVLAKLLARCSGGQGDSTVPVIMAMDALMAGIDTTGNTAAFLLYHLAAHPDKQELLHAEIMQQLQAGRRSDGGGSSSGLTEAQLAAMKYLRAVQKESQRILPAISGLNRITQKDIVLSGYRIPAGTGVAVINHVIMTSPENFPDPETFRPERWLKAHAEYQRADPFTHLVFGHGPRYCTWGKVGIIRNGSSQSVQQN